MENLKWLPALPSRYTLQVLPHDDSTNTYIRFILAFLSYTKTERRKVLWNSNCYAKSLLNLHDCCEKIRCCKKPVFLCLILKKLLCRASWKLTPKKIRKEEKQHVRASKRSQKEKRLRQPIVDEGCRSLHIGATNQSNRKFCFYKNQYISSFFFL